MDNVMDMHLDGDRICDLAEGALDPAQRAEAEAHVKGCADCRRELEAARAYLRDLSDLTAVDPVKAPPNFLASVRARLPQPSPMKRLWDGFLRPFRVIPMQVALLTVLGLTAISSYLYQRGGLHESPSMVAVNPASADSEPPSPQPEPSPGLAANKEAELISALPKRKGHSRQLAAVPDAVSGNAAGSGASVGRISPVHPAKPAAPAASAPGPSRAHAVKKTAEDSKRKAVSRRDAEGVYEELESIPMKDEAAISASSDVPPAAAADMDEAARSEPKAKISAPKELPGFSLRLAFGKQSAEVLAGLKAMGAELESGPERAKSGGPAGDSYVLRLPASMIKDLAPYLERYGKAERDGILPAGQSPVRILLRIVPAPK